jgi:hypothetical protein
MYPLGKRLAFSLDGACVILAFEVFNYIVTKLRRGNATPDAPASPLLKHSLNKLLWEEAVTP